MGAGGIEHKKETKPEEEKKDEKKEEKKLAEVTHCHDNHCGGWRGGCGGWNNWGCYPNYGCYNWGCGPRQYWW